jgi:membrane protein involved in colicin uptake
MAIKTAAEQAAELKAAEDKARKEAETKLAADAKAKEDNATEVKAAKGNDTLATQDKPAVVDTAAVVDESYVWLANGDVLRVKNEDIPQGGHLTNGHWQRGDKVYQVVGVYPVEEKGLVDD